MTTTLTVGARVRRTRPHSRLEATAEYTVSWVHPRGLTITLKEVPNKLFNAAYFELVPAAPEPAEEGTFVCVDMEKLEGSVVSITGPMFKHWVDAEQECERASRFLPKHRFGVLKLVGTVKMKPSWS
jgi:hypothetical protein